jgi:hypothetical protein
MRTHTRPCPPVGAAEQLISALLPDVTARRPAPPRAPMPTLPASRPVDLDEPDAVMLGTVRVDRSGRFHERALLRALGWEPGRSIDLDVVHEAIVMMGAADGAHRIDARGAVALPAAARRMCGIPTGSPVVLVAIVHRQLLIVHPARTVARVLAAHHTGLIGTDDVR